jgi:hypothetical protein
VQPPTQRTPLQFSGGTLPLCNGAFALDVLSFFAAHPAALGQPLSPGRRFDAQYWIRDPGAPHNSSLSNAIAFDLIP